jgi:hypothetical protein
MSELEGAINRLESGEPHQQVMGGAEHNSNGADALSQKGRTIYVIVDIGLALFHNLMRFEQFPRRQDNQGDSPNDQERAKRTDDSNNKVFFQKEIPRQNYCADSGKKQHEAD